MNIQQFIDLIKEEVIEQSDGIIEAIIVHYQVERDIESDKEVKEQVSLIPDSDALKAIRILYTYEEQQVEGDNSFGRVLRAQERVYLARRTVSMTQGTLTNWLSNTNSST